MLRIFAVFLGPVFAKEMVEMARRKRYYFNRVLYGLVLLVSLSLVWKNYHWQMNPNGSVSIKVMATMARAQFDAVSGVQYAAVFLLVPLFLCGVIASEREERTLDLLFTTQLTDREIVLGKLTSRVVVLVLLILTALPIMSLIMFFGGVDPASLWRIIAATLLATLYAGAHAIYFSAVTKSPIGALVRTYWWMAVWLVAVPLALALPAEAIAKATRQPQFPYYVLGGLIFVNPIGSFVTALDGFSYTRMVGYLGEWFFPLAFVIPATWSVFLIWRAVCRLRLAPTPFARLLQRIRPIRVLRESWRRRSEARAKRRAAWARRFSSGLGVQNPLWLRALWARVYDREGYIGRIQSAGWLLAFFFLVLFALFEHHAFRSHEFPIAFLAPTWIGLAALTAILAATSLVGDRRRGFLDLVLMAPLKPGQVIDGTMLALWQHLKRSYWLPWVLGLFFCLTGSSVLIGVLASMLTGTLFCTLLLLHGVVCSLTAKTLPGALLPTILFPILMNVGLVFFIGLFRQAAGPALWVVTGFFLLGTSFWVRRNVTAASVGCYFMAMHLTLAGVAVSWTWKGWQGNSWEFPIASMHPGFLTLVTLDGDPHRWFRGEVEAGALLLCYWIALAVNILWARWWTIRHFDRLAGRTRPAGSRLAPARIRKPRRIGRRDEPSSSESERGTASASRA